MKRITNAQLSDISPLCDVRMEPLYREGGRQIDKMVVVLDPTDRNLEVGTVSPGYELIPNKVAYETALDVLTRTGLEFKERRVAFDGKRYRQRWVLPGFNMEPAKGDFVNLGLDLLNSYDGSTRFSLSFIAERLVCLNGMVADFMLGGFSFKHFGGNGEFKKELEEATDTIQRLGNNTHNLLPILKRLVETPVDLMQAQTLLRCADPDNKVAGEAFMSITEPTEWGVFNGLTKVTTDRNTVGADRLNRDICRFFMGDARPGQN